MDIVSPLLRNDFREFCVSNFVLRQINDIFTMAGERILLVFEDGFLAHSGEEVIGMIVFAHMLEAEPPLLVLPRPPLGRRNLATPNRY